MTVLNQSGSDGLVAVENFDTRRLQEEVNSLCMRCGVPARYLLAPKPAIDEQTDEERVPRQPFSEEQYCVLLAESEKRYRTLFDLSPVAVYVIDAEGRIQQFNQHAAELWAKVPTIGDTDQLFCGSHKMFLPDGTYLPHNRCPMATVVSGEIVEARDAEVVIERPDLSRITVIVNIVALRNEHGDIIGAINCFYDITERSRLELAIRAQAQELTDLHTRKDEFLAMLSHELRNPLAPIVSAVDLLRLQKAGSKKQQDALTIIERQAGQLVHLIDDLMEVSRITNGKIQLDKKSILMSDVVNRAIETTQPHVSQRRHKLTVSLPRRPVWVNADADRIEQVIVNLITNAAKYTDVDGHIWLTVQQNDDMMELRVRDSGIGIHPQMLPHVFSLFTQADRSLDRSHGGLGLGLCLVQRLVELHDGRVTVDSILGSGSEFTVTMPAIVGPSRAPPPPVTETAQQGAKIRRVLVVDDNVDGAQTMGLLLEASGYDVQIVHDGLTVLDTVLDFRPDAVVLDIGLPGLSGFDVAKSIRQHPVVNDIMLVALTGYGMANDRQLSGEAGFDHHLVKPAVFTQLHKILSAI